MVEKHGIRKSKTFSTYEAAQRWASLEVDRISKQKAIASGCINSALGTSLPTRVLEALKSAKYTHQEIVSAAMPLGQNTGVYFLLHQAVVVYVGQSIDLFNRIGRHAREGGKVFDAFTYILCSADELDKLEETYVTALMPRYNIKVGGRQISKRKGHPYNDEFHPMQ